MEILNKIQKELKAPKSQYNSFGKYKYRSCEDILEAVKPLLNTATLIFNDKIIYIGDRYYIESTVTITDKEKSVSSSALAREQDNQKGMNAPQITGSASSYARKYALNALFCIDDTKDDDYNNNHSKTNTIQDVNQNNNFISQQKTYELVNLMQLSNTDSNKFYKYLSESVFKRNIYKIENLYDFEYEQVKKMLLKKAEANAKQV